jgi:glycosyltransferase involved in cell wall biosynthesis
MSLPIVLFGIFAGIVVLQIAYYTIFLSFYASKPVKGHPGEGKLGISVIVCARNESDNLKTHIPLLLEQDHQNFELVLVNDGSTDDSLEVMEEFAAVSNLVRVVDVKRVESFWGNKKYALTLGIKASVKPYLVFTDADCKPGSRLWLRYLEAGFSKEKEIVLAYGAYRPIKKSFLNLLIRFETVLTALQYFSFANAGMPYMGVGRNLAYKKEVFFGNGGFMNHIKILSGDDDLFINNVATKENTTIVDHPDSHTISQPKIHFSNWFQQKRRHVTTSSHYKPFTRRFSVCFTCLSLAFLFWDSSCYSAQITGN